MIAGVIKGLLRVAKIDPSQVIDVIPVDFSINLIIAATWDTAQQR